MKPRVYVTGKGMFFFSTTDFTTYTLWKEINIIRQNIV